MFWVCARHAGQHVAANAMETEKGRRQFQGMSASFFLHPHDRVVSCRAGVHPPTLRLLLVDVELGRVMAHLRQGENTAHCRIDILLVALEVDFQFALLVWMDVGDTHGAAASMLDRALQRMRPRPANVPEEGEDPLAARTLRHRNLLRPGNVVLEIRQPVHRPLVRVRSIQGMGHLRRGPDLLAGRGAWGEEIRNPLNESAIEKTPARRGFDYIFLSLCWVAIIRIAARLAINGLAGPASRQTIIAVSLGRLSWIRSETRWTGTIRFRPGVVAGTKRIGIDIRSLPICRWKERVGSCRVLRVGRPIVRCRWFVRRWTTLGRLAEACLQERDASGCSWRASTSRTVVLGRLRLSGGNGNTGGETAGQHRSITPANDSQKLPVHFVLSSLLLG